MFLRKSKSDPAETRMRETQKPVALASSVAMPQLPWRTDDAAFAGSCGGIGGKMCARATIRVVIKSDRTSGVEVVIGLAEGHRGACLILGNSDVCELRRRRIC
jgi:hypothetical protein